MIIAQRLSNSQNSTGACVFGLCVFGLCASVCLALGVQMAAARDDSPRQQASLNPLSMLGKDQLSGFVEEPLFDPARRLPPPPVVQEAPPPPPPPPAPPPNIHLLGLVQSKRSIAIVQLDEGGKTQTVSTGDMISGWKVVVLPTLGIQLQNGERVVDFKLFNPSSGSSGVTPVTPVQTPRAVPPTPAQRLLNMRNARLQRRTY